MNEWVMKDVYTTCFHGAKLYYTVVPLLRDHPVVHAMEVFEEGWSFIRGENNANLSMCPLA